MSTFDKVKDLPLEIESYELEGLKMAFSPQFARDTTLIKIRGGGHEGIGEDVVYDNSDHEILQKAGPYLDLAGTHTFDSFSELLGTLDLFPEPPPRGEVSRLYRRWAFESAALDLALRQAGMSLAEAVGREHSPLNYVVSMRLKGFGQEGPETPDKALRLIERYPTTRLKLDPTNEWTQELVDRLVATGAVDSLDLKGFYRGTPVDVITDPELYRMCAESFPDAWLEDPDLTEETLPILEPHRDRLTWDAPIHSVDDIKGLRWKPRTVNVKPSRFGSVRALFSAYDYCEAEGIGAYGGGQTELGPGRGQIQLLASIFHPDTPNDVAPSGFNEPEVPDGLPPSPLEPRPSRTGFRWEQ